MQERRILGKDGAIIKSWKQSCWLIGRFNMLEVMVHVLVLVVCCYFVSLLFDVILCVGIVCGAVRAPLSAP